MEWEHPRKLVFSASEQWMGWFCERCCWNIPLPAETEAQKPVASRVFFEFEAHDCEKFAGENWQQA
jgi:hypothetical protein